MKVLIVKTSSLGDVIHTLPALSDAMTAIPNVTFDWVVEDSFQDIPRMQPNVDRVIPTSIRLWRKNPFKHRAAIRACIKNIQQEQYDVVIDAQGLIKSAIVTWFAKGKRYGLSKTSCREPLAALAYQKKIEVEKGQHAISRVRQLFAKSLGYSLPDKALSYGLKQEKAPISDSLTPPYLVFLHATTWASKHWPNEYWRELILLAVKQGFHVYLPWGNETEKERASALASASDKAHVLPRSTIKELTAVLMYAKGVVGVDSGLAHLTAACSTPAVTLYGSTSAILTGTMGLNNTSLQADFPCSPCLSAQCQYKQHSAVTPACYEALPAAKVWQELQTLML
jgi:heptosyltransferase-1